VYGLTKNLHQLSTFFITQNSIFGPPAKGTNPMQHYNNNNNDRLTAFDPGQPG